MTGAERMQVGLSTAAILVGTAIYGWVVYGATVEARGADRRMEAPGIARFMLDEPGTWSIYYEYIGAPPSRISPTPMPDLDCEVMHVSGTAAVVRPANQSAYRIGGTTGIEMLEVDAVARGEHAFTCRLRTPYQRGPSVELRVGKSVISKALGAIAVPTAVYLALVGVATMVLLRVLKRTQKR